jgi:threonine/homoserine/homoserine lactone efflux protein
VVTKNTLVGGHRRGRWTALGVSSSNLVQGSAAAAGLSTGTVLLGFGARLATEHV